MKLYVLIVITTLFFLSCMGTGYYKNKTYSFQKQDSYKVALFPISSNLPMKWIAEIDTMYSLFYKDTINGRITIPPYETEQLITESTFEKIRDFSIDEPTSHTLSDILTEEEIKQLNSSLSQPDFIVVPHLFKITSNYQTQGFSIFRAYEMQGGRLLYEKTHSNSMGGCPDGDCTYPCSVFLLGDSKVTFNKYLQSVTQ